MNLGHFLPPIKRMKVPKPSPAKAQRAVDLWNASQPVGAAVTVRKDNGEIVQTRTTEEAMVAPSGHAVVWLEGIRGHCALDRVSPLEILKKAA